jgi:hypothetical protein
MGAGRQQVRVISWSPAKLLMFIQAFSLFNTQGSYRARKLADMKRFVALAIAAGGGGLEPFPFQTMLAQLGAVLYADRLAEAEVCCCCGCCCRCGTVPASLADWPSLPVCGGGGDTRGQARSDR